MARLFDYGQLVMSAAVMQRVVLDKKFSDFILASMRRHTHGDWGDMPDEDKAMNDRALKEKQRLISRYNYPKESQFGADSIYIITEADRSVTTAIFTYEY